MTSRTFGTKSYPQGFPAFIKESFAGVDLTNHASLASLESAMLRIGEYVDEVISEILDEQTRFARMVGKQIKNAKESDSHRGAFKRTIEYKIGDVVTHDGGLWVKVLGSKSAPGVGNTWQLAGKKTRRTK